MERSAPSTHPPSTEIDLSWRMREREARTLAQMMRNARFSLLHAEPGVGRTELLAGGVLPLLRRRASDAVGEEDRESRVVIPFSDRRTRRAGRSSTRIAERAVLFDGWGAQPTAGLRTAILGSLPADAATYARSSRLAPMMGELSRRFDAQFLVILDSFERFWDPALTLEEAEAFVDELSEAAQQKGLRAHFLLSIDDQTDPRLDTLRRRIDAFDESVLKLLRWDSDAVVTTNTGRERAPPAAATAPGRLPAATSPVPVLSESVTVPSGSPATLPRVTPALPPGRTPAADSGAIAAPKARPRRPKPPRVPVVKPEPIRTEGVYAFIESTLTQTASDFAPWQDGEDEAPLPPGTTASHPPSPLPSPVSVSVSVSVPSPPPRPSPSPRKASNASPRAVKAPEETGSGQSAGRDPGGRRATPSTAEVKPSGPIDKWLAPVVAWSRRLRRKP